MEFLIRDRLSWLRFPGFRIGEPVPDQKTIRPFREKLTRAGAFKALFAGFEEQPRERGYKPAGGRIVDATPVSAPRQRMSGQEKERTKTGESASDIRPDDPAKAARKDTNARWTVKYSKAGKTQRRQGGCRSRRYPGSPFRGQEPYLHRPQIALCPRRDEHGRGALRRTRTSIGSGWDEQFKERPGGYRIPVRQERSMARGPISAAKSPEASRCPNISGAAMPRVHPFGPVWNMSSDTRRDQWRPLHWRSSRRRQDHHGQPQPHFPTLHFP